MDMMVFEETFNLGCKEQVKGAQEELRKEASLRAAAGSEALRLAQVWLILGQGAKDGDRSERWVRKQELHCEDL